MGPRDLILWSNILTESWVELLTCSLIYFNATVSNGWTTSSVGTRSHHDLVPVFPHDWLTASQINFQLGWYQLASKVQTPTCFSISDSCLGSKTTNILRYSSHFSGLQIQSALPIFPTEHTYESCRLAANLAHKGQPLKSANYLPEHKMSTYSLKSVGRQEHLLWQNQVDIYFHVLLQMSEEHHALLKYVKLSRKTQGICLYWMAMLIWTI